MLIAVFINEKTNEINNFQKLPADWSEQEAILKVTSYNQNANGFIAELRNIEKNSLCYYLISALEKKKRYTKETIENALSAIREAEDAINSLEVAKECEG